MKFWLILSLMLGSSCVEAVELSTVAQNTTVTTNVTTANATVSFGWGATLSGIALNASQANAIKNALGLSTTPATMQSAAEQVLGLSGTNTPYYITTANTGAYTVNTNSVNFQNSTSNNQANIISGGGNPILTVDGNSAKKYAAFGNLTTSNINEYIASFSISTNTNTGNVVNTVNGSLTVQNNGFAFFHNAAQGNVINTIIGNVNVSSGSVSSRAHFANLNTGKVINIITGQVNVSMGGIVLFYNNSSGSLINTVNGGVNVSANTANFYNNGSGSLINTVNGGINVSNSSRANFYNVGSGSLINTVNGGINVSGSGIANFNNNASVSLVNTVTGGVTVAGSGEADFGNYNSTGTVNNNIDTVTLQATGTYTNTTGCFFGVGGYNSTTNIGTFNWQSGPLQIVIDSSQSANQAGNTTITNFNITGTGLRLAVHDLNGNTIRSSSTSPITLFTATNVTGNLGNISIHNGSPLTEITSTSYGSNNLNVTIAPTATSTPSEAVVSVGEIQSGVTAAISGAGTGAVNFGDEEEQANSFYQKSFRKTLGEYANAFNTLKKHQKLTSDNLFSLLNDKPLIMPVQNTGFKVWGNPYYSRLSNAASGNGYHESVYGCIIGGDYRFKQIKTTLGLTLGYGSSLMTINKKSRENNTKGKQNNIGIYISSTFFNNGLYNLNVNHNWGSSKQQRIGNPTPTSSYLATAKYKTNNLSVTNEISYVFKFKNDISVRPNLGLSVNSSKRFKFKEKAPENYAQSYKTTNHTLSEVYGGVGFRKKWVTDSQYTNKLTFIYEIGHKNGSKNLKDKVYTQATPNGVNISTSIPGKLAHYLTLSQSIDTPDNDLKFSSTFNTTLQKKQKSYRFGLKVDCKF